MIACPGCKKIVGLPVAFCNPYEMYLRDCLGSMTLFAVGRARRLIASGASSDMHSSNACCLCRAQIIGESALQKVKVKSVYSVRSICQGFPLGMQLKSCQLARSATVDIGIPPIEGKGTMVEAIPKQRYHDSGALQKSEGSLTFFA